MRTMFSIFIKEKKNGLVLYVLFVPTKLLNIEGSSFFHQS